MRQRNSSWLKVIFSNAIIIGLETDIDTPLWHSADNLSVEEWVRVTPASLQTHRRMPSHHVLSHAVTCCRMQSHAVACCRVLSRTVTSRAVTCVHAYMRTEMCTVHAYMHTCVPACLRAYTISRIHMFAHMHRFQLLYMTHRRMWGGWGSCCMVLDVLHDMPVQYSEC